MKSGDELFIEGDKAADENDYETAFNLFMKGAEIGHASCMTRVAYMYTTGDKVDQNYEKALYWYKKANEIDKGSASHMIAGTYREINDIKNYKKWLEIATEEKDDGDAALDLAKLYMISDKETENVKKYLKKAISSKSVCQDTVEEATELISSME